MNFSVTTSKYLSRQFLGWFFGVLIVISVIIGLIDFSELARRASGKPNISTGTLIQMTLLKMPELIQKLMPFIVFFSTMLCLWRLNRNSELIVMRAAGISAWQFLAPIVFICGFIGVVQVSMFSSLASSFSKKYDSMNEQYFSRKSKKIEFLDSGIWIRQKVRDKDAILKIEKFDLQNARLEGVSILLYNEDGTFETRLLANKGRFDMDAIYLQDVWQVKNGELPEQKASIVIPAELTINDLMQENAAADAMSFWELSRFINILEKSGLMRLEYRLTWHSFIAKIFWLMAMVYLAASCSLGLIRQNNTLKYIAAGILINFVVYIFKDVTFAMGAAGTIPLLIAAWIPAFMTYLIGFSILLRNEDG